MSINYKKINQLLKEETYKISDLNENEKEKVLLSCEEIYRRESVIRSLRSPQMVENIINQIKMLENSMKKEREI